MAFRSTRLPAALCAATALLVAACTTGTTGTTETPRAEPADATVPPLAPGQEVSITFETYNLLQAGAWTDTVKALIDKFHAAHPNIRVTAQPPQGAGISDSLRSVQNAVLAGRPPDVAQVTFSGMKYAAQSLNAKSYDSLFGAESVSSALTGSHPMPAAVRALGKIDNATYSVPYVVSTPVLFYNASLFQKAGLDPKRPPANWADAKAAALAIKSATGADGVYIDCLTKIAGPWCLNSLVYSAGGSILHPGNKLGFADDAAVNAVTMGQDLVASGASPKLTQQQALTAFQQGKLAMILESSAVQSNFQKGAADNGWELAAGYEPGFGSAPPVPTNSGAGLMIFSGDPAKQRAAWELVQFLTSAEAYGLITPKMGYLPMRPTLLNDPAQLKPWADQNPLVQPNVEQLGRIRPQVEFPGDNYLEVIGTMMEAVESVVYDGKDARSTLSAAQKQAQTLLPAA